MSKEIAGDLVIFDASDQGEGLGPWMDTQYGSGGIRSLNDTVVYNHPLTIKSFKIVTGDGGDVLIYSRKVDPTADPSEYYKPDERKRYIVLDLPSTTANDALHVPMGSKTVDGVYIDTLPASAKVYLELGD